MVEPTALLGVKVYQGFRTLVNANPIQEVLNDAASSEMVLYSDAPLMARGFAS
jgi:hypothetical protein